MPTPNEPIGRWIDKLVASVADGSFVRLTLSGPINPTDSEPERIIGRLIELHGAPHLSVTQRHPTRDVTSNLSWPEAPDWIRARLTDGYRNALLCTTRRDWQLVLASSGPARLVSHPPSIREAPARQHDREKPRLLDNSARDWLHGLGLVDDTGRVRARMADKHRQVERYLEILSHLATDCNWGPNTEKSEQTPLVIADMGCGKGYLTFGAWHLLHRIQGRPVRVIGVEAREGLVIQSNALATRIGADGLDFQAGTIESAKLPRVDALIALHACDTATDHALRKGVDLGAKLILLAPCCHKEVRPQMKLNSPLGAVLQHGLMEERLAEWATDGLRALALEWAGYRTKVFEFISSEHTAKNLMIAAVRTNEPFSDPAARDRWREFRNYFGLEQQSLDEWFTVPGVPH